MLAIPYPPDFDVNYHQDWRAQREEAIMLGLDIGDVLAEVDAMIADEPDPTQHPFYQIAAFLLNQDSRLNGGKLYDDSKRLCAKAIERLIDEAMQRD